MAAGKHLDYSVQDGVAVLRYYLLNFLTKGEYFFSLSDLTRLAKRLIP